MSRIENNIHFIWIGTDIPDDRLNVLLLWLGRTGTYSFYLWTDPHRTEEYARRVAELCKTSELIASRATLQIRARDVGHTLVIENHRHAQTYLHVLAYTTLPALNDPALLYEEIYTWRNYGAASDFLRIWALHQKGGVYLDLDTYPGSGALRPNLSAPRDILFARTSSAGKKMLTNAIIACSARNPALLDLSASIDWSYEEEFPTASFGTREVTDAHWKRFAEAESRREMMRSGKYKLLAKNALGYVMGNPTINRSGPGKIREWIGQREGSPVDEWLDSPVDPNVQPRLYSEWTESLYCFQDQTGYDPIILSKQSWVQ